MPACTCSPRTEATHRTTSWLCGQDALWTETNGGTNRNATLQGLPAHLQPQILTQMYRPLMDACPFLFDCTTACCVGFLQARALPLPPSPPSAHPPLQRTSSPPLCHATPTISAICAICHPAAAILQALKVQVCDRGDVLMRAGSMRLNMYILQRGEIKIDYDPEAPKETAEFHVPGGRIGGSKAAVRKTQKGKDAMRGRTDKIGTLLGFQDVFKKVTPIEYTVTALSRCALLSISRGQLKDLLSTCAPRRPSPPLAAPRRPARLHPCTPILPAQLVSLSSP